MPVDKNQMTPLHNDLVTILHYVRPIIGVMRLKRRIRLADLIPSSIFQTNPSYKY